MTLSTSRTGTRVRVNSAVPVAARVVLQDGSHELLADAVVMEGVLFGATAYAIVLSDAIVTHADGHQSRGYRAATVPVSSDVTVSRRRLSVVGAVMLGTAKAGLAVALLALAVILEFSGGG